MNAADARKALRSGTGVELLEALFWIGGQRPLPSWLADVDAEPLIMSPDPAVRERAIFVFGIRQKDARVAPMLERVVVEADALDWTVISAALLALHGLGRARSSSAVIPRLVQLLDDPAFDERLGAFAANWLLFCHGLVDDRLLLSIESGPANEEEKAKVRAILKRGWPDRH